MGKLKDQILVCLALRPEGADDDQIAADLGLDRRQAANSGCRMLEKDGYLVRRKVNGKIRNFMTEKAGAKSDNEPADSIASASQRIWHWEGNVQSIVVKFLVSQDYSILSVADTKSKQKGHDIEAAKEGRTLWITVKGYPIDTPRTRASVQAGHWFKDAVFDLLAWHGEGKDIDIGIALPDFPRYRRLFADVAWLQQMIGFKVIWVSEDGKILEE